MGNGEAFSGAEWAAVKGMLPAPEPEAAGPSSSEVMMTSGDAQQQQQDQLPVDQQDPNQPQYTFTASELADMSQYFDNSFFNAVAEQDFPTTQAQAGGAMQTLPEVQVPQEQSEEVKSAQQTEWERYTSGSRLWSTSWLNLPPPSHGSDATPSMSSMPMIQETSNVSCLSSHDQMNCAHRCSSLSSTRSRLRPSKRRPSPSHHNQVPKAAPTKRTTRVRGTTPVPSTCSLIASSRARRRRPPSDQAPSPPRRIARTLLPPERPSLPLDAWVGRGSCVRL